MSSLSPEARARLMAFRRAESPDPEVAERLRDEHPGRIRLFRQANRGPYVARNLGLEHVRGEFVVIYDAEDAPAPDQLKRAVAMSSIVFVILRMFSQLPS